MLRKDVIASGGTLCERDALVSRGVIVRNVHCIQGVPYVRPTIMPGRADIKEPRHRAIRGGGRPCSHPVLSDGHSSLPFPSLLDIPPTPVIMAARRRGRTINNNRKIIIRPRPGGSADACGRQTVRRRESPLIVRNDWLACRPIADSTYGCFHDGRGRVLTIHPVLTIIGTTRSSDRRGRIETRAKETAVFWDHLRRASTLENAKLIPDAVRCVISLFCCKTN